MPRFCPVLLFCIGSHFCFAAISFTLQSKRAVTLARSIKTSNKLNYEHTLTVVCGNCWNIRNPIDSQIFKNFRFWLSITLTVTSRLVKLFVSLRLYRVPDFRHVLRPISFSESATFLVLYLLLTQWYWKWLFLVCKWYESKRPVNVRKTHLERAGGNEKCSFNTQNCRIMNHKTAKQIEGWVTAKWKDTTASDLEKICMQWWRNP